MKYFKPILWLAKISNSVMIGAKKHEVVDFIRAPIHLLNDMVPFDSFVETADDTFL